MAKVMVGIPTNSVKYYCLGKLLNSLTLLKASSPDIRIVFTDDTRADDSVFNQMRGGIVQRDSYSKDIQTAGYEVHEVTETTQAKDKPCIRQRLVNSRNLLRKIFLESDCTHLFFIDSDVIVPKFAVQRLLEANEDIVSGVYWQMDADGNGRPVVYKYIDTDSYLANLHNMAIPLELNDLVPSRVLGLEDEPMVSAIGFGCVMLSRKIMEDDRWQFRYDESTGATEDMWWSIDVKNLGYNIYCDTAVLCNHFPKPWVGKI